MNLKIIIISFLMLPLNAVAFQQSNDSLNYSLKSPYHTVFTHLNFLQDESYNPEISARSFNSKEFNSQEARELAIKLKQVLDGKGIFIDLDDIPRNPDYEDSVSGKQRYVLIEEYPEIYLEKAGDKWYYSETAAMKIQELHDDAFPFGTFSKFGSEKYLGLYFWQYIGILILIAASYLIHKIFTFLSDKLITGFLIRAGYKDIARNYILPVAKPLSLFFVFLLLYFFVPAIQLPVRVSYVVNLALAALLPFFATLAFYKSVDLLSLYFEKLAEKTESTLDDQLVPLFRKTLKTFVVVIGGVFILQNLDIEILPLLAGLSIGGLAFALAAQDTVKNFFGSLMIFVDKPFQIGDWITYGDVDGTVEEVGIRSTRIRTFRNSVVYVPNGSLANATIDNHGLRVYRRFSTQIAVNYDTPPDLIEQFVEGLKKIVETHPDTRKDFYEIHMNDMASHSLNIMFYIFFSVPTWSEELKCRHEVILSILRLAEQIGINFAFPTQTLHVENFPGKPSLSPSYMTKEEIRKKLNEFFSKK